MDARVQTDRMMANAIEGRPEFSVVSPSGKETPFTIDAMLRQGMLDGLDQIELTRAREPQIAAFQVRDRARHPWLYLPPRQA